MSEEIKKAVRQEMAEAAEDVDALTYAEVYGFEDEQIEEAMKLQSTARVAVTLPGDDSGDFTIEDYEAGQRAVLGGKTAVEALAEMQVRAEAAERYLSEEKARSDSAIALMKRFEVRAIGAEAKVDRLSRAIHKLAGWAGHDISTLIEEGMLEEGDLS